MFPQRNPLWKFLYCNKIPAKKFAEKNAGKFSEKIPMGKLCRVPSKFFGEVPSGKKNSRNSNTFLTVIRIPTPEGAAALGSWKPLTVQLETIKPWNSGTLEARKTVNLETWTLKHRKSCLRTVWNLFFWSHAPPHPLRPKVIEIPSSRWRINPTLCRNPDLGLDLFTLGALIEGIEY